MEPVEQHIRAAVFRWLADLTRVHGDVLPRGILEQGPTIDGQRVPLLGPQGIFKPRVLSLPISITTTPGGPYPDRFDVPDRLTYAYRGTDPRHADNVGLRAAMVRQTPLIYFHGIRPGWYLATYPVFVVGDNPGKLAFAVQFDDARLVTGPANWGSLGEIAESSTPIRRAYVTATVQRRVHQEAFRERVLRAYRDQCALCRLRHRELLDAAHIIADAQDEGDPVVPNALSLCKLHHAAYDRYFLAVRPDFVIEVRRDILDEVDGPMLLHGLKGMHGVQIQLPRDAASRPDPARLEYRYAAFRRAI